MRVATSNLSFSYGTTEVLSGVSIEVEAGESLALLGPNGSGKTTLLRLLATLAQVQKGSVLVGDKDLSTSPGTIRRELGVVFQSPALDKRLSVLENLRSHAHMYAHRWSAVSTWATHLLERLALSDRRNDRIDSLSGGLVRRVELAKALLCRPKILLLDEPTASLDPSARASLWGLLAQLRLDMELTVIVSTHLLDEADNCDRVAMLEAGKLVAYGKVRELVRDLGRDIVTVVTSRPQFLADKAREHFAVEVKLLPNRIAFTLPSGQTAASLVTWLANMDVDSVTIRKPDLEDLYFARTGKAWGVQT